MSNFSIGRVHVIVIDKFDWLFCDLIFTELIIMNVMLWSLHMAA